MYRIRTWGYRYTPRWKSSRFWTGILSPLKFTPWTQSPLSPAFYSFFWPLISREWEWPEHSETWTHKSHMNTTAQHATNNQAMAPSKHMLKLKVDLSRKKKDELRRWGGRCVLGVEWGDWTWRRLGWGLLFVKWAHTEMAKPHHPPAVRWARRVQVGWVISWASAIRHTCRVKGNLFLTHLLSLTYQ